MPDALERLRAANPVADCPPPSIQDVWKRVELDGSSDTGRHHGNRPGARSSVAFPSLRSVVAVFATVTAIVVAVVALALLGHRHTDIPASRADSPPALFTLHAQAGQLLGANPGLPARVQALRGYPIVVNAWASWCQPCRNDLRRFASASSRYGQKSRSLALTSTTRPRPRHRSSPSRLVARAPRRPGRGLGLPGQASIQSLRDGR
jgi:thiol-disulfide isomerase/thioredoxin